MRADQKGAGLSARVAWDDGRGQVTDPLLTVTDPCTSGRRSPRVETRALPCPVADITAPEMISACEIMLRALSYTGIGGAEDAGRHV